MNLFYQPGIRQGVHYLDQDESRHCVRVLRHREGELIRITDGEGTFYDATITNADARRCTFEIQKTELVQPSDFMIEIAVSPTRNADRIEWFAEKAVEFGIHRIIPVLCQHSERRHINADRLIKVAASAMKQSLKAWMPYVGDPVKFSTFLHTCDSAERFIAVVDPSNPTLLKNVASPARRVTVLIGPEGDFSSAEVSEALQAGFRKVSLGPSRLRTETAALAACHILNLVNQPA